MCSAQLECSVVMPVNETKINTKIAKVFFSALEERDKFLLKTQEQL